MEIKGNNNISSDLLHNKPQDKARVTKESNEPIEAFNEGGGQPTRPPTKPPTVQISDAAKALFNEGGGQPTRPPKK